MLCATNDTVYLFVPEDRYPIRKKKVEVSRGKRDSANRFAFSFFFFFSQIIIIQLRDTLLLYIRRLLFRVIKRH